MDYDLEDVGGRAENYVHLQGLRFVPVGVPFLISAAARVGWFDWVSSSAEVRAGLWFLLFFVALACGASIGRYYRARYGAGVAHEGGIPRLAVVAVMFAVLLWIHREILQDRLPVPLQTVLVGVMLVRVGLADNGLRRHYLPIGIAWLGLASLEPLGVPNDLREAIGDIVIAGSFIVGGLADHQVLGRVLRPVVEPVVEEEEGIGVR